MSKRLVVDREPWRRTDFHFDESENKVTLNTVQDAEPIVEENKRKMNAYGEDTNGAIQKDPKLLARYLNDPDHKYFKVAPTNI